LIGELAETAADADEAVASTTPATMEMRIRRRITGPDNTAGCGDGV
jgi:hypothetical protein